MVIQIFLERITGPNESFSPEFLREGSAIKDNLYPSRIIVGDFSKRGKDFKEFTQGISMNEEDKIYYMQSKEAEAVKLFLKYLLGYEGFVF